MDSILRGVGRLIPVAIAVGLGIWCSSPSGGVAGDLGPTGEGPVPRALLVPPGSGPGPKDIHYAKKKPTANASTCGTLGYGPPGLQPGFQGFGLGYHLGYGYGGAGLGPGAFGGYPYYGGPGYPHPWPTLNRFGNNTPFPYYGGPGGPSPSCPNFFAPVGPLAPDRPVVIFERNPDTPDVGEYGGYTGSIPYPETTFAPFTTIAGSSGSYSGVSNVVPPPNPTTNPPSNRSFGVDGEPVPDSGAGGVLGLKIVGLLPGSIAEKAGLRVGDVLLSINGRLTQRSSDLFAILESAAANTLLKVKVRTATDGKEKDITIQLP